LEALEVGEMIFQEVGEPQGELLFFQLYSISYDLIKYFKPFSAAVT
jgi:hypothetical protein